MKTLKIGVFGLRRGGSFFDNILLNNGEIVAVCDMDENKLAKAKEKLPAVTTYKNFDEMLEHKGLEAVLLCNYFHEHASYAIKALEKNIHVLSECTSNSTMAEGVALVRAAEKSKAVYMLSENYPFFKTNLELRRVYRGGTLGKVLFAEGEYNHPVAEKDLAALHPFVKHWRNFLPRSYYITHALSPLMYMTGSTPRRVTAFGVYDPHPKGTVYRLAAEDRAAIITTLNDDDSVFRVTGCAGWGGHENSYRLCCEKGQIEAGRGRTDEVTLRYNSWEKPDEGESTRFYTPEWKDVGVDEKLAAGAGHGGGDFLIIKEFIDCVLGGKKPLFDVYFATTMASVAILAHRSLLERGTPYDIPDFTNEEDRKKWENDSLTPFWSSDGKAPTIRCTSRDGAYPTEEEMPAYEARLNDLLAQQK